MGGINGDGALRNAPVPVIVYGADATLRWVNDAAVEAVAAASREGLLGRQLTDFIEGPDPEDGAALFRRVIEDREQVAARELALRTVDGDRWHAEVACGPVTYDGDPAGQAILQDVTDRQAREGRLRAERDRFTALFEGVPEPIVVTDFVEGEPVVEAVNPAFEETFGYDAETAVGRNLNDLIVPEDRMEEAGRIDRTVNECRTVERELPRETADGERRDFLFRTQPLESSDGDEWLGIYVDITDRTARERELQRQNERLEEFAGVVSHDLRTPLSVAAGNLELYRRSGEQERLDTVEEALDQAGDLLEELLTLARKGEAVNEPEPVELAEAARNSWQGVATDATLEVEASMTVEADPTRLRELLGNLFENAVEHGAEDVTVTVGGLEAGFYVADDGSGVPEPEREEVFDPGYTTADDGTGFGLAIVKEIAEAHGWSVSVAESEAGGARFELALRPDAHGD